MDDSAALTQLPAELQQEYAQLLAQARLEIHGVEGADTIRSMLLERYVLSYCMLKDMERAYKDLDLQRYNQLYGIWLKVASDLLEKYKEIYSNGAASELFVTQVIGAVADEVKDPEILQRIRSRIATSMKEEARSVNKR